MNLPNRLSLTRICLVPVCAALLYLPWAWCRWTAFAVFCAAAFTDFLDGRIARKRGLVTNFGKFIDPVADKLLVLSTMAALTGLSQFPVWALIAVLFRELAVDGLRLVAVEQGKVIAAGPLGKAKTVTQLVTLALLLAWPEAASRFIGLALIILTVLLTVVSGADYFRRSKAVLRG